MQSGKFLYGQGHKCQQKMADLTSLVYKIFAFECLNVSVVANCIFRHLRIL